MQREAAGFPPFAHLALLRAEAKHVDTPMQFLRAAKELLLPYAATGSKDQATAGLELHGPLPAPMPRRAGMHRAQLLVSAANRRTLHGALDAVVDRKSVVVGKRGEVRVNLGGGRINKKKQQKPSIDRYINK